MFSLSILLTYQLIGHNILAVHIYVRTYMCIIRMNRIINISYSCILFNVKKTRISDVPILTICNLNSFPSSKLPDYSCTLRTTVIRSK